MLKIRIQTWIYFTVTKTCWVLKTKTLTSNCTCAQQYPSEEETQKNTDEFLIISPKCTLRTFFLSSQKLLFHLYSLGIDKPRKIQLSFSLFLQTALPWHFVIFWKALVPSLQQGIDWIRCSSQNNILWCEKLHMVVAYDPSNVSWIQHTQLI